MEPNIQSNKFNSPLSKIDRRIIIPIIIILLIPLAYFLGKKFLPGNKTLPNLPIFLPRKVNLASGRLIELNATPSAQTGPAAVFVEQDQKLCDQSNISNYLGLHPAIYPDSKMKSFYGESSYAYALGGKILSIAVKNPVITYTILSDNNTQLKIPALINISRIATQDPPKQAVQLKADSLKVSDQAFFYLTVKCSGNRNPLLMTQIIISSDFINRQVKQ